MSPADLVTMANMMASLFFYNLVVLFVMNLILSGILGFAAKGRGRVVWRWILFGVLFSAPIAALFLVAFGDTDEKHTARLRSLRAVVKDA